MQVNKILDSNFLDDYLVRRLNEYENDHWNIFIAAEAASQPEKRAKLRAQKNERPRQKTFKLAEIVLGKLIEFFDF